MRALAAIALALIVAPGTALATDRYVAKTGNDASNDCSVAGSPCLTIQHALGQAAATGDVINVGPGNYAESLSAATKNVTLRGAGAGLNPAIHTRVVPGSGFGLRMFGGGTVERMRIEGGTGASSGPALIAQPLGGGGALSYTVRNVELIGGVTGSDSDPAVTLSEGGTGRRVTLLGFDSDFANPAGGPVGPLPVVQVTGPDVAFGALRSEFRGNGDDIGLTLMNATGLVTQSRFGTDTSLSRGIQSVDNASVLVDRSRVAADQGLRLNPQNGATVNAFVRDSVVGPADLAAGFAIVSDALTGSVLNLDVRQSTLYGRAPLEGPLSTEAMNGSVIKTALHNTIVHNFHTPGLDIFSSATGGGESTVTANHSLYRDAAAQGAGTVPTPGTGTNVAADPQFVDPPTENFALRATSPAIDRGDPSVLIASELDFVGAARNVDGNRDCAARPDIGAFELQGNGIACPAAPQQSGTAQTPPVFAPLQRLLARITGLRVRRTRRGLSATFRLDQAGLVRLVLARDLPGLRRGRSCVRPTRSLRRRRARRCRRFRSLASARTNGRVGANTINLRRRLGRGRYRVTLTVANGAAPATSTLTVR
jgi:hypothetical protein